MSDASRPADPADGGGPRARHPQLGGARRGRRTCPTPPGRPTGRTAGAGARRGRRTCPTLQAGRPGGRREPARSTRAKLSRALPGRRRSPRTTNMSDASRPADPADGGGPAARRSPRTTNMSDASRPVGRADGGGPRARHRSSTARTAKMSRTLPGRGDRHATTTNMSDASRPADQAGDGGPRARHPPLHPRGRAKMSRALPMSAVIAVRREDDKHVRRPVGGRTAGARALDTRRSVIAAARSGDDEHVRRLQAGRPGGRTAGPCTRPRTGEHGARALDTRSPARRTCHARCQVGQPRSLQAGRTAGARALDTRSSTREDGRARRSAPLDARGCRGRAGPWGRRTCPLPAEVARHPGAVGRTCPPRCRGRA